MGCAGMQESGKLRLSTSQQHDPAAQIVSRMRSQTSVIKHSYQTMNRLVVSFRFLQALIRSSYLSGRAGESLNGSHHLYALLSITKRITVSVIYTLHVNLHGKVQRYLESQKNKLNMTWNQNVPGFILQPISVCSSKDSFM